MLKFKPGSEGFTFVDAVVAILLSAMVAAAVFPLFALFTRQLPQRQIRHRDVVTLINLEADIRQQLEATEVPYWSDGPGITESEGNITWSKGEAAVSVVRDENTVSVTSSGLTRRYTFSEAPVFSLLNSEEKNPIGLRMAAAKGTVADVLFHERLLESAQDAENDDAGP